MRRITLLTVTPLLILGACSDPVEEPSPASDVQWPDCETVWQEGQRVPDSQRGCTNGAGYHSRYGRHKCLDGSVMLVYAEETWTVNGIVKVGNGDERWADGVRCVGEEAAGER